jgi:enoyl-CoA hydratase/carnithine racemase
LTSIYYARILDNYYLSYDKLLANIGALSNPQEKLIMALTSYVSHPQFEDYQAQFSEHFRMERRDGIIMLEMHTLGEEISWSWELHRAIGQAFRVIASDPHNEVMILTSAGESWVGKMDKTSFEGEDDDPAYYSYEMYTDGAKMLNSLIQEIEIPTIGVVPGPGFHLELPLLCDLTICSDTAVFGDGHLDAGFIPGDGIHCAFIELLGIKRAAWILLMCEWIDAEQALQYGLVNEVVEGDKLIDRAWDIAEKLASRQRITSRLTTQLLRRPWRQQLLNNLDVGWTSEMWAFLADKPNHTQAAESTEIPTSATTNKVTSRVG